MNSTGCLLWLIKLIMLTDIFLFLEFLSFFGFTGLDRIASTFVQFRNSVRNSV